MRRVITLLAFALALGMMGSPASAQGIKDAAFSWSGFYVGGNVGHAWGDVSQSQTNGGMPYGPFSYDTKGFTGGVAVGFNSQFDRIVLGVEAEGGWMNLEGEGRIASSVPTKYQVIDLEGGLYGLLTARAGIAIGRTLIYGKGGWAYWDGSAGQQTTNPGYVTHRTGAFSGHVYGAGIEQALAGGWSVKVEWLRFDFGGKDGDQTSVSDAPVGFQYTNRSEITADTVKLGLNFKF